jgi:hypothetical protein
MNAAIRGAKSARMASMRRSRSAVSSEIACAATIADLTRSSMSGGGFGLTAFRAGGFFALRWGPAAMHGPS